MPIQFTFSNWASCRAEQTFIVNNTDTAVQAFSKTAFSKVVLPVIFFAGVIETLAYAFFTVASLLPFVPSPLL